MRREVITPSIEDGLSFNPSEVFSVEELNYMNAYVNVARPEEYFFVVPERALEQRRKEYEKLKESEDEADRKQVEYIDHLLKINNCFYCYNNLDKETNTDYDMITKQSETTRSIGQSTSSHEEQTNNSNWEAGEKLLVYFDIMGFRSNMNALGHNAMLEKIKELRKGWENMIKPLKMGDSIRMTQFSDTIILVANGITEKHFNLIAKAAIRIIQCSLQNGFAIKGVMTQGEFAVISENQIYFGHPLVDAYENFEDVYFYSVLVHHTAEGTIKQYASEANPFYEGVVPLKGSKPKHCYLAWWMLDNKLAVKDNRESAHQWISELEMKASGKVRMYMKNTTDLINQADMTLIHGKSIGNAGNRTKSSAKRKNGKKKIAKNRQTT